MKWQVCSNVLLQLPFSVIVSCVRGKTGGLREGDECVDQAEAYKLCRKRVKDAKLNRREGSTKNGAAAPLTTDVAMLR